MSEKSENKKPSTPAPSNNVVQLDFNKCKHAGCKSKPTRMHFCSEHYDWFKYGLITKDGEPAKDFEKKYQHFMRHKAA